MPILCFTLSSRNETECLFSVSLCLSSRNGTEYLFPVSHCLCSRNGTEYLFSVSHCLCSRNGTEYLFSVSLCLSSRNGTEYLVYVSLCLSSRNGLYVRLFVVLQLWMTAATWHRPWGCRWWSFPCRPASLRCCWCPVSACRVLEPCRARRLKTPSYVTLLLICKLIVRKRVEYKYWCWFFKALY